VACGTLAGLFGARVAGAPGAVAVVAGDVSWSYGELDAAANRVAWYLIGLGIGPEQVVAVSVERSAELVAVLLGVVKAGAAFLPVDPGYPAARIAFMLADARPAAVVCTTGTAGVLPGGGEVPVVVLDDPGVAAGIAGCPGRAPGQGDRVAVLRVAHPAYVIYTSGSTGAPKGVVVTHGGIASLAGCQIDRFGAGPGARVLAFAPVSFDAAVSELCVALLSGGVLVVAAAGELPPGGSLGGVLGRYGVTHVTLPPSVLAAVAADGLPAVTGTVVVAGEACPPGVAARWLEGRRLQGSLRNASQ